MKTPKSSMMPLVPDADLTKYQPKYSSEDLRRAKEWGFGHSAVMKVNWKYNE